MRTLHAHLLTLKDAQNVTTTYIQQLEQRLMSGQAAQPQGTTPAQQSSQLKPPKMAEPPKFSGKGSSLSLEQWIKKVQIWLNYNKVNTDKERIMQANSLVENGVADYMEEYNTLLSKDKNPSTWADFVKKLEMGYKMLDPKRTAQAKLDEHCEKKFSSMIDFAEKFRSYAPQSGYSDEDLIVKVGWLEKKLCIYCRKHAFKKGVFCKNPDPKYKGKKFQMPSVPGKKRQVVCEVEKESPAPDDDTSPEIRPLEEALYVMKAKRASQGKGSNIGGKGKGKAHASEEEEEQNA
ncbi:uncharacterized protein LAESUDRAFT_757718 [Laetiporus sulphureus 93-53]|uniref:Retrotransposon gag domain-containing protein n=1 Tax=Laetiporus sulphureus 93-53 TaxID=1314785 RepID=A0A165F6G3_9APHY|nr:uncharacterized protein LAESUDRAFT_757718 [Laetiporus sulphureus 93-53]KZT08484.1 hypothetical protein LAESUDRAFT_757718 [Laetiporus sulphureus 93-53]